MTAMALSAGSTTRSRPPRAPSSKRARLLVVDGPERGRTHAVGEGGVVIGSDPGVAFALANPTLSRRHFSLQPLDGRGWLLRDLGSTNGTRVGGARVSEALLEEGALINAGASGLQLVADGDGAAPPVGPCAFGRMVAVSSAMRQLFALLARAAACEATVLVEGESGTGKELIAESIHANSARKEGPFVVVDCSALPAELIESELFGHERGAFTGAVTRRDGAVAAANGGTLFLDEIGELPLALQARFLRVLETRQVKRIGSTQYHPVDVRVVAATNRNLAAEVAAGRFRFDLYYRLAVVRVHAPPLRDRLEDVPLLAHHFAERILGPGQARRAADAGARGAAVRARVAGQRARAAQRGRASRLARQSRGRAAGTDGGGAPQPLRLRLSPRAPRGAAPLRARVCAVAAGAVRRRRGAGGRARRRVAPDVSSPAALGRDPSLTLARRLLLRAACANKPPWSSPPC